MRELSNVVDYREVPPDRIANLEFLKHEVVRSLQFLTAMENRIIQLRYGLSPFGTSYTIEETARILKVTPSRIRGIECKAICKLQYRVHCENLIPFSKEGGEFRNSPFV